jgi:hypothetical protein
LVKLKQEKIMKMKTIAYTVAALGIATMTASPVFAGSMPNSKAGIASGDMAVISASSAGSDALMTTYIKVAQDKDMIFDLSAECGLYTRTLARSKGGNKDTATAEASVRMNIVVTDDEGNEMYAYPGGPENQGVVFCSRAQELSAEFQGIFENTDETNGGYYGTGELVLEDNNGDGDVNMIVDACDSGDVDPITGELYEDDVCEPVNLVGTCLYQHADNNTILLDTECLEDETVELVLDTMNANAFNFVAPNLKQGVYKVEVFADIDTCASKNGGDCVDGDDPDVEAKATIGRASLVVDERRFIQDEDGWQQ